MSGDREAASEQSSSVYKGAGYNELYPSGHEPKKYITLSPKRELSTHSPAKEEEENEEDREETVGDEDEEGEGDGESKGNDKGNKGKVDEEVECQEVGDGSRPFILPLIWTVNNFYPTMSPNVFNKLRNRFRIPDNIPICLPKKYERCYLGKTIDVGM